MPGKPGRATGLLLSRRGVNAIRKSQPSSEIPRSLSVDDHLGLAREGKTEIEFLESDPDVDVSMWRAMIGRLGDIGGLRNCREMGCTWGVRKVGGYFASGSSCPNGGTVCRAVAQASSLWLEKTGKMPVLPRCGCSGL